MKAFWKLMPKDLQRHLRVDGNIHSEDTFWKTRAQQKAMEAEQMAQKTENFDLAARLTTAQIRRLEAEKLLLETRLRWEKTLEEARATNGPTSGQSQ